MSGSIFTAAGLLIGVVICGGGLYYLWKDKKDPEARKINLVAAIAGAALAIGFAVRALGGG